MAMKSDLFSLVPREGSVGVEEGVVSTAHSLFVIAIILQTVW